MTTTELSASSPLPNRRHGLSLVAAAVLLGAPTWSAQMPKEDVVDVPAVGPGLCVSNLFQSNMVLQRDAPMAIWGWAEPGAIVTLSFGEHTVEATANKSREWRASLPAMPAQREPATLTIRSGEASLALTNVLVGDVWILGGQSNMEFELAKVENGALEIASANYESLRILTVPYEESRTVVRSFPRLHEWSGWFSRHFRKGDWDVCSPAVAKELSAIGYAFARRVHMASGVPIGVIDASRGGTSVETWTPIEILQAMESEPVKMALLEWETKKTTWDPASGKADPATDMNYPGNSYGGILGPLVGLSVKGAIFHQGYNNTFTGMRGVHVYEEVLPAMITAWRKAFNNPKMPFGIISLCTDGYPQTRDNQLEKMLNAGIHIRAAQYRIFEDLQGAGDKNIGFASSYDLRRRWYHPQVKIPAGERIARWALATQYGFGRDLLWVPPKLVEMEATGGALTLRLDTKVSDPEDGAIEGFVIAGEDRRFQPATVAYVEIGKDDRGRPKLDRKQLVLTSPLVPNPIHFRYAWGRNPMGNLQVSGNKDLPFATQRSDDWDMGTVPLGVLEGPIDGMLTRPQQAKVRAALRKEDERRKRAEAAAVLK